MARSKASALLDGDEEPTKAPPQDPKIWDRAEENDKREKLGAPPLTDDEWNKMIATDDGEIVEPASAPAAKVDEPGPAEAGQRKKAERDKVKAAADRAEAAHEAKKTGKGKGKATEKVADTLGDAVAATKARRGRKRADDDDDAPSRSAGSNTAGLAGGQILAFVERIERLDEEAKTVAEDRKEVLLEAKGSGFDTKIIRRIIATRKMDKDKMDEEDSLFELYMAAMEQAQREEE